jgi:hypothetical protein
MADRACCGTVAKSIAGIAAGRNVGVAILAA